VVTATTLWLWWPEELAGWNTGVMAEAYIHIYAVYMYLRLFACAPSLQSGWEGQ
jgi:hypothetical protein